MKSSENSLNKNCNNIQLIVIILHTNCNGTSCISYIQRHFNYFHIIAAKLCTTELQNCQEPEKISVGNFVQKQLLDLGKMSQMFFSLFLYLDSVNCNHRYDQL